MVSDLNVSERIEIFNEHSYIYYNSELDKFLNSIGTPYSIIVQNGKRPLIENNNTNMKFVSNLKQIGYISKFDIEKKGIRISTFKNK